MPTTPMNNSANHHLRARLTQAIKLNRMGNQSAALRILKPLAISHPRSAPVAGYLGGIYFEAGRIDEAVECFRRASTLSPRSELPSLGLFHSLWATGDRNGALAEMRRFVSIAPSAEYARLIEDLAGEAASKLATRPRATA